MSDESLSVHKKTRREVTSVTPGKTHRTVKYGEISESQKLVTTPNKFHFQWSSAGCSRNGCNAHGFVCAQCMKFNDAQQNKSRRRAKSQGGGNGLARESLSARAICLGIEKPEHPIAVLKKKYDQGNTTTAELTEIVRRENLAADELENQAVRDKSNMRKQLSHQITRVERAPLAESIERIERLEFSLYNVPYGEYDALADAACSYYHPPVFQLSSSTETLDKKELDAHEDDGGVLGETYNLYHLPRELSSLEYGTMERAMSVHVSRVEQLSPPCANAQISLFHMFTSSWIWQSYLNKPAESPLISAKYFSRTESASLIKGAEFLESAAEQGRPDAQLLIGKEFLTGSQLVDKDLVQAQHWLNRAAVQQRTGAWFGAVQQHTAAWLGGALHLDIAEAKALLGTMPKLPTTGSEDNRKSFVQHVREKQEVR